MIQPLVSVASLAAPINSEVFYLIFALHNLSMYLKFYFSRVSLYFRF